MQSKSKGGGLLTFRLTVEKPESVNSTASLPQLHDESSLSTTAAAVVVAPMDHYSNQYVHKLTRVPKANDRYAYQEQMPSKIYSLSSQQLSAAGDSQQ